MRGPYQDAPDAPGAIRKMPRMIFLYIISIIVYIALIFITMNIAAKVPGPNVEISPVTMEFRYASSFGLTPPEAYERLLLDCLSGDSTLFIREDEVEASWSFITPIHDAWANGRVTPFAYPAGSWGPLEVHNMIERDGRSWRKP